MLALIVKFLGGLVLITTVLSAHLPDDDESLSLNSQLKRQGKLLFEYIPFVKITVDPTECETETEGVNGTCYSRTECSKNGGNAKGSCANGFGVCCLFEQECGAVVMNNQTFLTNIGYPSSYTDVGNCQYIIEKMNPNICQLRLDMETMRLAGPSQTSSMCEEDTFTIVGTAGENPRVICGDNSGQHMYLDLASGTATARINIATTTQGKERAWKIKVSQIECNSIYRAPAHCLQYYTDYSGSIKSFNYKTDEGVQQIGGQSYTACVKTREGFCGITYKANTFSVSGNGTNSAEAAAASGDTSCGGDFVSIFTVDKTNAIGEDRYCGNAFNDTITFAKPFQVRVMSDETEPVEDENNKGFELKYMQIPC